MGVKFSSGDIGTIFGLPLTLTGVGSRKPLWKIPGRYKIPEMVDPMAQYTKAKDVLGLKSVGKRR